MTNQKHVPPLDDVRAFLVQHHGAPVDDLEPISGGFWSAAYGYVGEGRRLVLRLGTVTEGFVADWSAMAFTGPDLPVPKVLDIGEALGVSFAISERHDGRFLETTEVDEIDVAGPALLRLLHALRAVPPAERPDAGWRWRVVASLLDDPTSRTAGWRATLAADAPRDRLFRACEQRVGELVDACPERRDLIHGDLLHKNVLMADDAARINAVFSWKCSERGDFLYDTAWCTFWGGVAHPGIAEVDVLGRLRAEVPADDLLERGPIRSG